MILEPQHDGVPLLKGFNRWIALDRLSTTNKSFIHIPGKEKAKTS